MLMNRWSIDVQPSISDDKLPVLHLKTIYLVQDCCVNKKRIG